MRRPPEDLGPFDCVALVVHVVRLLRRGGGRPARCSRRSATCSCRAACWCSRPSTATASPASRAARSRAWEERDGTLLLIERFFDPVAGRAGERLRFIPPDGEEERRTFSTRLYTATELVVARARGGPRGGGRVRRHRRGAGARPTRGCCCSAGARAAAGDLPLLSIPASPGKFVLDAGPFHVRWYGFLIALGVLHRDLDRPPRDARRGYDPELAYPIAAWTVPAASSAPASTT